MLGLIKFYKNAFGITVGDELESQESEVSWMID